MNVEGNSAVASVDIIDAAQNAGLGFGASRRAVRSEKVKNALLASIPDLNLPYSAQSGVNIKSITPLTL